MDAIVSIQAPGLKTFEYINRELRIALLRGSDASQQLHTGFLVRSLKGKFAPWFKWRTLAYRKSALRVARSSRAILHGHRVEFGFGAAGRWVKAIEHGGWYEQNVRKHTRRAPTLTKQQRFLLMMRRKEGDEKLKPRERALWHRQTIIVAKYQRRRHEPGRHLIDSTLSAVGPHALGPVAESIRILMTEQRIATRGELVRPFTGLLRR